MALAGAALDLATMGGGVTAGFLFRQVATIFGTIRDAVRGNRDSNDDSRDKAAARGGVWIRRGLYLLVAAGFLSVLVAGFMEVPVVVETTKKVGWWPFRSEQLEFVTVQGVLFIKENRTAFLAMLTFYFGQAIK